jgi:WhiB family redox-sensing transcriptional regulator
MNQDELDLAACKGIHTDVFFPEGPPNTIDNSTQYAKNICASCPVSAPCLKQALDEDMSGIWGGTTEQERKAIRLNIGLKPIRK